MVRCGARKALASGWQVSRPGKSMAHAGEGTPVPMHRERPRVTRSRGCWANPEGSGVMVIVWLTGRRCGAGRRDRRKARARGHGAYRQSAATLAARWCDRAWRNAGAGSGEGTSVVTDMLWLRPSTLPPSLLLKLVRNTRFQIGISAPQIILLTADSREHSFTLRAASLGRSCATATPRSSSCDEV